MAEDNKMFNCSEQHEHDYMASQYPEKDRKEVREFLKSACESGRINNNSHKDVIHLLSLEGFEKDD